MKIKASFTGSLRILCGVGILAVYAVLPACRLKRDPLMYLNVLSATASGFDQTPDWAPPPDPMAAADGDIETRWAGDTREMPQWIAFDLGRWAVVNEIILRWERAHAVRYEILVSGDGTVWSTILAEEGFEGGTSVHRFTPVPLRYLKVLCLEKVNPDWPVSLWEVELYGPASANPGALYTKEKYIGLQWPEEKFLSLNEPSVQPPSLHEKPFQKGVVYTSWMRDELALSVSDRTLMYLRDAGYDTVEIMIPAYQETLESTSIFTSDEKISGDTPSPEALRHAIGICRQIGLRVMVKPHVDPRIHEPRMKIQPSDAWFDSYENFILRYAVLAQEQNAEIFCIGTELEATTIKAWDFRWRQLIREIKKVYSGQLVYAANWTEYQQVSFWDEMDWIGLDAYFPLSSIDHPEPEDLVSAWEKIADEIEHWRSENGLTKTPVVLTEIGYPSAVGAARQPWAAATDHKNLQQQADCFDAVFSVLSKRPWFQGFYIYQYFPQNRWSHLGFTVKGKPSEEVIRRWMHRDP